jgi:polyisoprenoid-binding protein YceI
MAWNIDPTHSEVTFSVRHLMISKVAGSFNVFKGELEIDDQNLANSWVKAEADVSSVNTRDPQRDGHLKSPDFFDAEKYPTITFASTSVTKSGSDYKVTGDLSIHGVTKAVIFDVDYSGNVKDPYGMQRAGLSATTKINRGDFGMTFNSPLETGGVMLSDEVKITIDLEAVKAN